MKMPIIALGRQFGSGGREIGKRLAEKLNVRCYDRELITLAAQKAELREELFVGREEKAPNPWLFTGVYEGGPQVRKGQPAEDILFEMQSRVIMELAQMGPCIIVGRCADISCGNGRIVSTYSFTPLWRPGRTVSCACTAPARRARKNAWRRRTRGAASTTSTIPTGIGACPRTTTSLWTAESSASSGAWTSSPSWQRHCKKLRRILIFPLTNLQNLIE